MNDFSQYEKIPSRLRVRNGISADETQCCWVVTEKVHGANFSFIYREGKLRYAKRRGLLGAQETFFSYQTLVARLRDQITALCEALDAEVHPTVPSEYKCFTVYGELFGGHYPHPDVKSIKGISKVQKGVYYSPDVHFYAFDIAVKVHGCQKRYLDYQDAISYFERFGLFYAKPLFIGTLDEATEFDIRINSTIPAELGLPPLTTRNLIEGVVVKPYAIKQNEIQPQGSIPAKSRPIVKIKNADFLELDDTMTDPKHRRWDGTEADVAQELCRLVNWNRLESAISKIGPLLDNSKHGGVTMNAETIQEEMWQDVLEDYGDRAYRYWSLSKGQRAVVQDKVETAICHEIDKARSSLSDVWNEN